MDKNTQHTVLSELYSATGYLERLLFALNEVYKATPLPQIKELEKNGKRSLQIFVEKEIFHDSLQVPCLPETELNMEEVLELSLRMFEGIIKFKLNAKQSIKKCVEFVNLIYSVSHPIHKMIDHYGNLDIQYPRSSLIEVDLNEEDLQKSQAIARFELKIESFEELFAQQAASISSLQWQRNKKAKEFIRKGHESIFKQEHEKGLEYFLKARNYTESAEVLTLIGWTHSLLNDPEKAKSFCLKAIQKDPDYGPPYNDMGTYLLDEGLVNESIKWFALAKKCSNYQNREYPYINSGRAHMANHDYEKALEEFSQALTFAPFHEELHNTIKKLKQTIYKKQSKFSLEAEENPPLA